MLRANDHVHAFQLGRMEQQLGQLAHLEIGIVVAQGDQCAKRRRRLLGARGPHAANLRAHQSVAAPEQELGSRFELVGFLIRGQERIDDESRREARGSQVVNGDHEHAGRRQVRQVLLTDLGRVYDDRGRTATANLPDSFSEVFRRAGRGVGLQPIAAGAFDGEGQRQGIELREQVRRSAASLQSCGEGHAAGQAFPPSAGHAVHAEKNGVSIHGSSVP